MIKKSMIVSGFKIQIRSCNTKRACNDFVTAGGKLQRTKKVANISLHLLV